MPSFAPTKSATEIQKFSTREIATRCDTGMKGCKIIQIAGKPHFLCLLVVVINKFLQEDSLFSETTCTGKQFSQYRFFQS